MAEEEEQAAANTIKIYQPTYQLEPKDTTVFRPSEVRKLAEQVVEETLKDQKYDEENAREWSLEISETIKSRVKALNMPRYKLVVQVTIGESKHQGAFIASRCLWNPATDNYCTLEYKNQSLFCSCIVFGCYTD